MKIEFQDFLELKKLKDLITFQGRRKPKANGNRSIDPPIQLNGEKMETKEIKEKCQRWSHRAKWIDRQIFPPTATFSVHFENLPTSAGIVSPFVTAAVSQLKWFAYFMTKIGSRVRRSASQSNLSPVTGEKWKVWIEVSSLRHVKVQLLLLLQMDKQAPWLLLPETTMLARLQKLPLLRLAALPLLDLCYFC